MRRCGAQMQRLRARAAAARHATPECPAQKSVGDGRRTLPQLGQDFVCAGAARAHQPACAARGGAARPVRCVRRRVGCSSCRGAGGGARTARVVYAVAQLILQMPILRPASAREASGDARAVFRRRGHVRLVTRLVVRPQRRRNRRRVPRLPWRAVAPAGGTRGLLASPLARASVASERLPMSRAVSSARRGNAETLAPPAAALRSTAAARPRQRASSSARRSSSARARFCARVRPLCSASSFFRFSIAAARPHQRGGAAAAHTRVARRCSRFPEAAAI